MDDLWKRLDDLLAECKVKPWIKSPEQQARENSLVAITKEVRSENKKLKQAIVKVIQYENHTLASGTYFLQRIGLSEKEYRSFVKELSE